jgi:hypothetical protein
MFGRIKSDNRPNTSATFNMFTLRNHFSEVCRKQAVREVQAREEDREEKDH